MRAHHVRFSCSTLLVASVAVFAHAAPQSHSVDSPSRQSADYEVAGCLRSGDSGTPNASGSSVVYTLQERTNPNAKAPSATTGTAATETAPDGRRPTTTPSGSTYTLSAPASVRLADHVGHKVLLTGHLQASGGDANTRVAPGSSSPTTRVPAGGAHRTLQISALRMLAATCE